MIRYAMRDDIPEVVKIYHKILELEEEGKARIGWQRDVYPTEKTALDALEKNELFVMERDGRILAAARINQEQEPEYAECRWMHDVPDSHIMVIHTLVVDPEFAGHGIGSRFIQFYEKYAQERGCRYLRMDTNAINTAARALYKKLGYSEQGIISCVFNGIGGVRLVCLEKSLE